MHPKLILGLLVVGQLVEKLFRANASSGMHAAVPFVIASLGTAVESFVAMGSRLGWRSWPADVRVRLGCVLVLDAVADLAFVFSYAWSSVQAVEVITKSRLVFGTLIMAVARRRLPTLRELVACLMIVSGIVVFVESKTRRVSAATPLPTPTPSPSPVLVPVPMIPVFLGIVSCVAVETSIWLEAGLVRKGQVCKNTVKLCTSALAPVLIPLAIASSTTLYADVVANPRFDPAWEMHAVIGFAAVIAMATWSTKVVDVAVVLAGVVFWFVPALVVAGAAAITRNLMAMKMNGHAAGLPASTSALVQIIVFVTMLGGDMILEGICASTLPSAIVLVLILCGMALKME